jgi:prepilin peptidase CpaA
MLNEILTVTLFPGLMLIAAFSDLLSMTIPNRLIFVLTAGFFVLGPLTGFGWADVGVHVAVGLAAFGVSVVVFWLGWIAGGDVKLFVATSLWIGPKLIIVYSLYAGVLGMSLALMLLFLRALRLPAMLASQRWLVRLHSPKEGIPYGIALAGAGLLVYPSTPFIAALVN